MSIVDGAANVTLVPRNERAPPSAVTALAFVVYVARVTQFGGNTPVVFAVTSPVPGSTKIAPVAVFAVKTRLPAAMV